MTRLKLSLLLPGLLLSTTALAGVPDWKMSEASGQVTVASSGLVRGAARGATLTAGDVISTGAKGRAVIVRGQEYLVVAPNTRIRVADPAKSGGMTQIIEQFGNVIFRIKKMATPHFAVETPFLAAVVKGTTFSVTVTETGASVQVIEGKVEVETRDGGARYLVLPGDIGSVSAKAPGRLNVQGRETRTIVSPTESSGATVPTAQILQADPVAIPETPADVVVASPATRADPVIAFAVSEPPVRLGPVTDNMVSGALIAVASAGPDRYSASIEARPVSNVPATTSIVAGGNGGANATSADPTPAPVPNGNNGGSNGNGNTGNGNGNGGANATPPAAPVPAPAPNGNNGNGNGNGGANATPPATSATVPAPANSNNGNGGSNGTPPADPAPSPAPGNGGGNATPPANPTPANGSGNNGGANAAPSANPAPPPPANGNSNGGSNGRPPADPAPAPVPAPAPGNGGANATPPANPAPRPPANGNGSGGNGNGGTRSGEGDRTK